MTQLSHADEWKKIESKHFGRCIWQQLLPSRSIMVEMVEVHKESGGFAAAIVVKHFERQIPRSGSGKPWPKQIGTYVYLEPSDSNRWDDLDKALSEYRSR